MIGGGNRSAPIELGVTTWTVDTRSAPFELDATTWTIDTADFAETWAQAQSQLGLAIDATEKQRSDQIKNWNLNSQANSDSIFENITFIGVAKVGSEEIRENMKKWTKHGTEGISKKCTIAFVRDPFARFVSGYVEFEWRFEQARKKYNDTAYLPKYTFLDYKLGSEQRAAAFVKDLVSFNVIDWLHELPPNLHWFDKHVRKNLLFHRNAIAHVCPLVGRLRGKKIDFLGQLEHMSRDWKLMADRCEMQNLGTFDRRLASHVTSKDPQGTKAAIEKAFADDCHLKTAVCHLLKSDYNILSSHFDYRCTGCNNKIIHPLIEVVKVN